MNPSIATTDRGYEVERSRAEKTYEFAYIRWLESVVSEARHLPKVKRSIDTLRAAAAATLRGDPLPSTPKRPVSFELIQKQVELCRGFAEAELVAYRELLKRQGLVGSMLIAGLEEHADRLLAEVKRQKWAPAIAKLDGLFDPCPWIDDSWAFVLDRVRDLLVERLIPDVWFKVDPQAEASNQSNGDEPEGQIDPGKSVLPSRLSQLDRAAKARERLDDWMEHGGEFGGRILRKNAVEVFNQQFQTTWDPSRFSRAKASLSGKSPKSRRDTEWLILFAESRRIP